MIYPSNHDVYFNLTDDGISIEDLALEPYDGIFPLLDSVLMQSTGLKDLKGVDIFEGDIVHVLDSEQINQIDENGAYIDAFFEEIDEIDSVVFGDGCFKLKRTGLGVYICRSVEDFKIIGNIYENPELLEAIE